MPAPRIRSRRRYPRNPTPACTASSYPAELSIGRGERSSTLRCERYFPPRHDPLGHLEKSIFTEPLDSVIAPGHGRNIARWLRRPEKIGACADNGPRGQHGADRGLGVIADEAAEELAAGGEAASLDLETDVAVGVLQVGGRGARAQIDPAPDGAVTDEAVVALVGVAEEHAGGDLSLHAAAGTEYRGPQMATQDPGVIASVERAFEPGTVPHLDLRLQHHRSGSGIKHHSWFHPSPAAYHQVGLSNHD